MIKKREGKDKALGEEEGRKKERLLPKVPRLKREGGVKKGKSLLYLSLVLDRMGGRWKEEKRA